MAKAREAIKAASETTVDNDGANRLQVGYIIIYRVTKQLCQSLLLYAKTDTNAREITLT